jgi:hypothetical protein
MLYVQRGKRLNIRWLQNGQPNFAAIALTCPGCPGVGSRRAEAPGATRSVGSGGIIAHAYVGLSVRFPLTTIHPDRTKGIPSANR